MHYILDMMPEGIKQNKAVLYCNISVRHGDVGRLIFHGRSLDYQYLLRT